MVGSIVTVNAVPSVNSRNISWAPMAERISCKRRTVFPTTSVHSMVDSVTATSGKPTSSLSLIRGLLKR